MDKVHPTVEQAIDTLGLNGLTRRRLLGGAGLASASMAASALLTACSGDSDGSSSGSSGTSGVAAGGSGAAAGNFPATPKWKFVFVCHVTTNPFFTPTQYGAEDACKLLGCEFQWAGSKDSIVAEMVNATNTAVTAKADGIALAVVDKTAFREPVDQALEAGIPVVSYNADGAPGDPGTSRLA
jgi:simple sugar transport system substrate-binding protein